MTVVMPSVKQVPSPNFSATPIAHDLIIAHRTEGGYAGSVAWLCDRRANASAHLVMKADGSEVTQLVPLGLKAWAQCAFNGKGVSLEIEGISAQGMTETTMKAAASVIAWLCRAYDIPPAWAKGGQGRGICQHHDLGAAGGGHVDCFGVDSDDWHTFLAFVKEAYDVLGSGPLPPFALHGAPGPHEVSPPPSVAPEPSHDGAVRVDPADLAPPDGSRVAEWSSWTQQWLKDRGATALGVDGDFGPASRNALTAYLLRHAA